MPGKDHEILRSVHDLDTPLITLNYDRLLELSAPRHFDPITWKDEWHCLEFLHGNQPDKVLHLHGYYDAADSVVFDVSSYDSLLHSTVVKAFREALSLTRTLIYVGCGGTFEDPHFDTFRKWVARVCDGRTQPHYRLVRDCELDQARELHREDGIVPLAYGPNYADLVHFLAALKPARVASNVSSATVALRHHLPVKPDLFGRDEPLSALLTALLGNAPRPICIGGPPGFGKSTLALNALYEPRVEARFGPRRFFVRVNTARSLADMASTIAIAMGIKFAAASSPENAVLDALACAPALLVIDNLETVWEPASDRRAVEDWLGRACGIDGTVLLVTMRGYELPGHLGWQQPCGRLAPLTEESARQVFINIAAEHEHDPKLPELLRPLGGWPLAIVLMAHQANGESSLQPVLNRWLAERSHMLYRGLATDAEASLDVSLRVSIDSPRMTCGAKKLLQSLGYLPDGIADQDIEHVGCQQADARRLIELGLAVRDANRLRTPPLIQHHVHTFHPLEPADFAQLQAVYLKLSAIEGNKVGRAEGASSADRLRAEATNIGALLTAEVADADLLVDALCGWAEFVRFTGLGDSKWLVATLQARAPRLSERQQANLLFAAGNLALTRDHDTARALFEQARLLYQRVGDVLGEANCIRSLGDIALARSDHDTARALFDQARPLYQRVGDVLGEANCIKSLGNIALERSDHDTARALFDQARSLYQRVGAVLGEANCIQRLGDIALARSDQDTVRAYFDQALLMYESIREPYSIGWALYRLTRVVEIEARCELAHRARQAWTSINRPDLVKKLQTEFPECFQTLAPTPATTA